MGKIYQGILGPFSGKVGTVVGSIRKGQGYMRGLAASKKDARTESQLAQRAKFAITQKLLKGITPYLLAELKNRLKISIFLWRKSCASR